METIEAAGLSKSYFSRVNIGLIILIGLCLRVVWALLIPVEPVSDSQAYDTFAQNIWLHGVYGWTPTEPTSYWPVGTSALYALIYHLAGHNHTWIVVLNILLSIGITFYTFKLAGLFFTKSVALLTALLVSIWPTHVFFSTVLASELPYMLLTLVGIYYFFAEDEITLKNILITGVCFALAYYIRPLATTVLVVCAFCAVVSARKSALKTGLRAFAIFNIMVVAVIPWAKRNYDLYGQVVPMSTNDGAVFWMGNTPGTEGGYHELPEYVKNMNEYQRNQVLKQEAIENIKSEPVEFIKRTLAKFIKFHSHETIGVTWNAEGISSSIGDRWLLPLKLVSQTFWIACLGGGLVGVILFLRKEPLNQLFHPFILLWLSSAGLHALIVAQDRYHIPIVPFVAAFAAYAMCQFAPKFFAPAESRT